MTNIREEDQIKELKNFMYQCAHHSEWAEWTYDDFTAIKDFLLIEPLHKIKSLEAKLEVYREQEKRWLSQIKVGDMDAVTTMIDALEIQGEKVKSLEAKIVELEKNNSYRIGYEYALNRCIELHEVWFRTEFSKNKISFPEYLRKKLLCT